MVLIRCKAEKVVPEAKLHWMPLLWSNLTRPSLRQNFWRGLGQLQVTSLAPHVRSTGRFSASHHVEEACDT